jgi:plastocyanin
MFTHNASLPRFAASLVLTLSTVAITACGQKEAPAAPPPDTGKHVDAATAGSLSGRVSLKGTPPPAETLRMGADAVCAQTAGATVPSDATVVSPTGGVANAFVYVKSGLDPSYSFEVPTSPVVLDQKACHYSPRVVGVRVGQPLDIVNSDSTLHNVHAMPMVNQEFNQGQPVQGMRLTKTFTAPEVMVRFVCNVHGWMHAYIGVMTNPYFAVTDADGAFKIDGLPPGTYTIGLWHETLGTQEQQVTITEKGSATLPLTFATK